jgi:hypothetical protein
LASEPKLNIYRIYKYIVSDIAPLLRDSFLNMS